MIKNIFLPEQIRGYYLLPVNILGFDIGKTSVKAALIYCKGKETIIKKFFEEPIVVSPADLQERTVAAIKIILEQAGPYDNIITALPSGQAIFKELKLPFVGIDTIKKVISYEVEPLLPFSLQDAVIDCIITKENREENSSEILVAAVQNQVIAQHLALFEAAGAQPEKVTIDMFSLYGLYSIIPAYAQQKNGVVLLEIEPQSTRMAYIYNGQLRFIRTLQKGLLEQARIVAQNTGLSEQEAFESIIRYGLETDHDQSYAQATKNAFTAVFNDILFTLQSFTNQTKPPQSISKIILFGTSATIKGLPELVTDLSRVPTELFQVNSLVHNGFGISANVSVPQSNIVSLAAALPRTPTSTFNLRQKEFSLLNARLFWQQIIAAGLLLGLILGGLLSLATWQIFSMKKEARQSEQEVVSLLKEKIPKIPEDQTSLDEVIDKGKSVINQEEKTWSAFTGASRSRFLEYLLELTSRIDKQKLGLDIEKLTITADSIILKAQVRGYEELRALEAELRSSKLFSYIESPQDPKFTMNIKLSKRVGTRGNP